MYRCYLCDAPAQAPCGCAEENNDRPALERKFIGSGEDVPIFNEELEES